MEHVSIIFILVLVISSEMFFIFTFCIRPSYEISDLRVFPFSYILSPPGLDHFVTFNTSILFGSSPNLDGRIQPNIRIGCGFVNGNVHRSLITHWTSLYLQGGKKS